MTTPKHPIATPNLDSKLFNRKNTFPETGLQHSATLVHNLRKRLPSLALFQYHFNFLLFAPVSQSSICKNKKVYILASQLLTKML